MLPVTRTLLESALQEGQIVPYFQPRVNLSSGACTGFEVLARWSHPERGLISPIEFIPVAERTGLIGELTETLLTRSLAAAKQWPEHLTFSINVSPVQFQEASFPEQVGTFLERSGFPASRVTLEITESLLLDDLAASRAIAEKLKALGLRLALDDFGTGYSSLRYLHELPVDELKIDVQFVQSVISRPESRRIIAAIVGLGRSFRLSTIAEGIESPAQAEMLAALGCDGGQGWLYGPPVPEEQVELAIGGSESSPGMFRAPEREGTEVILPTNAAFRGMLYAFVFEGVALAVLVAVWFMLRLL